MPRATSGLISIDNAWQSVSLEERLELISRAHATGVVASISSMLLIGCVAYGFDKIWLLAVGAASSIFVFPLFTSYSWRREKPALILAYLAVRAVSRRYAYAYNIPDIDIVFIYRTKMKEIFSDVEEEALHKQQERVDFDTNLEDRKDVWVVLMRGGIVILSEKLGGARLEFSTAITGETVIAKPPANETGWSDRAIRIEGVLASKGRAVILDSKYPAAQYVFEKKLQILIEEQKAAIESLEKLRTSMPKPRPERSWEQD